MTDQEKLKARGGKLLAPDDVEKLAAIGAPRALTDVMTQLPLIGVRFGVMMWLNADGMAQEATDFYPGIAAAKHGYVPIGSDLTGGGDPYFYRVADGAIVRIRHDAADEESNTLDESGIEKVHDSIAALIASS